MTIGIEHEFIFTYLLSVYTNANGKGRSSLFLISHNKQLENNRSIFSLFSQQDVDLFLSTFQVSRYRREFIIKLNDQTLTVMRPSCCPYHIFFSPWHTSGSSSSQSSHTCSYLYFTCEQSLAPVNHQDLGLLVASELKAPHEYKKIKD